MISRYLPAMLLVEADKRGLNILIQIKILDAYSGVKRSCNLGAGVAISVERDIWWSEH